MFTCRDANEHMTDEREGALSGLRRLRYHVHVTICPHCRACRRQFAETVALAREIPPEDAPEGVVDGALAAFRRRSHDKM
jgi:anti-sigma factor ChrR (cupin superfamily)